MGPQADIEIFSGKTGVSACQREKITLVDRVARVGNQLTQENFLVGIN
ncbi:hypothetical protein SDC9_142793 [bioreactor metagenome]|uniref:Uncharacterized protein n=1 Tax=bioreactor metagenome TaxID=1076179 RepID=A0A645E2M0_9ZZZZ